MRKVSILNDLNAHCYLVSHLITSSRCSWNLTTAPEVCRKVFTEDWLSRRMKVNSSLPPLSIKGGVIETQREEGTCWMDGDGKWFWV